MTWWSPPAWPAPAKLNLMLRVLGRRADGYHLLQTVFQFLDFGDAIEYQVRADGGLRLVSPLPGVAPQDDLVLRAARLLQREASIHLGADISVAKRLPMGGGLGGGSSDAATTLVALNALWNTGFDVDALAEFGLRLGADVPVFVRGHAAWGEGIGDRLTPVDLNEPWYVVVRPRAAIATGDVFKDPELTRNSAPITIADFVAGQGGNDCLPVVRRRHAAVADALEMLERIGKPRLTGTGACVFAEFADEAAARHALRQLPSDVDAFAARGLNQSPLLRAVMAYRTGGYASSMAQEDAHGGS